MVIINNFIKIIKQILFNYFHTSRNFTLAELALKKSSSLSILHGY